MSCGSAFDAVIAGEIHPVACELPVDHTGVHRITLDTGTLISWPNQDHCKVTTTARGSVEQCRLRENHGSPHMTEDGLHLWLLDGSDTVITDRIVAETYTKPLWQNMFPTVPYGGQMPIRMAEIIDVPAKPAEVRTEENVARTYQERKRRKKS